MQLSGKSSWNIASARPARRSLRWPSGKSAIPNRISPTVTALIQTSAASWASSHSNTLGSGTGRISSDTTFVSSRIIQRHATGMWEAGAERNARRLASTHPQRQRSDGKYAIQDLSMADRVPGPDEAVAGLPLPWIGHDGPPSDAESPSVLSLIHI